MATAEITTGKKIKKAEKKKETTLEFISSMAIVLVTGLFIITFNMQAFTIPSSSMENTLLIGDHVFVDRIAFAPETKAVSALLPYRDIHQGDIVVFLSPSEPGLFVVKRIIGVPGDRIRLRNGVLYRNGQVVTEPYVRKFQAYHSYADDFPSVPANFSPVQPTPEWQISLPSYISNDELVVPPDRFFAMGDNRDVSYDSRYWGFIPRENVVGRPLFIYWSFEADASQYQQQDIPSRVSNIVRMIVRFFPDTRWDRLFTVVR